MALSIDQQVELLLRGTEHAYTAKELADRLAKAAKDGRQLRVKLGMDPTAPDLHLGHAVVLRKMRQFQDLGHKAVLIIGDATAMIGDPTGKKKTRPVLNAAEVEANAKTYFDQAGKILDTSPDKLEVRKNSEWLGAMNFMDSLKLAGRMTVARMLERDTFQERYKAGEPIYIHEFMYPLMQGWDSVMIRSDVELGGTDQTFNNLIGRDFQIAEGQLPQIVLIMPILVGIDGVNKMGKSLGNYIGVSESPREQFGKTMKIPDALMGDWFKLCTPLPQDRIVSLVDAGQTHPREAKEVLGRSIVEQYHDSAAAETAANEFRHRFAEQDFDAVVKAIRDVPRSKLVDGAIDIAELLTILYPEFKSKGEARRRVDGGAVSINGTKLMDRSAKMPLHDNDVVVAGKQLPVCSIRLVD
jgi:tyrosyl-tRNA synthetase